METLSAVSLTPISVLCKISEPRRNLSFPSISPFKTLPFSSSSPPDSVLSVSGSPNGGLVALLSSILTADSASALTYEEALRQSTTSGGGGIASDIDITGVVDSVISFAVDNPVVVGGGFLLLTVPLLVSQLFSKPKPFGVESAKTAYAKLGDDAQAQLLDIRAAQEIKKAGSPDIRGFKKKPVAVVYKGEDKPGFLKKLFLKFKEPENTTLFVLDKFDGSSELVAELATANGFKAAYAIRDGAEGSRGWARSGLPWTLPSKSWSLGNLIDTISGVFGDASDALPLTLGVVVAAGFGLLSFTEMETILELLGSAALVQFVTKKLLFAEDRKQTVKEIEDVLNTKVAPQELVSDIQRIGKALLPSTVTKALPAPAAAAAAAAPVLEANNAPAEEEKEKEEESVADISISSLSPYPNYPNYKPPSSPIPSQP